MKRYTLSNFIQDFSTNKQCLEYIKSLRWPNGIHCDKCGKVTKHHLIEKRKCYGCQFCGSQVYPTAGTIFHKSRTALPVWFYVIFQMSKTRSGVSAKQIERETGVTYKTAWRICQLVRATLGHNDSEDAFTGIVEVDETYVGGKPRKKGQSKRGRGTKKTPVVGIIERGNRVRAVVVANVQRRSVLPLMRETVDDGVEIHTDEFGIYDTLYKHGYEHKRVNHGSGEYVAYPEGEDQEPVHTNSIEGFWAHVKGGVKGVYHGVGPAYLQRYLNEYTFRYNNRSNEPMMFFRFLGRIAQGGRLSAKLT